jgi:glycosyltransferase involved in cell wall biosynthesis
VDTAYFAPQPEVRQDPFRLVFTGSMDWLPNEDGVLYFCREVLPRLRQAEPRISLAIVGRNPTSAIRRLAQDSDGIEVTGRVDDVRPHVAAAALSIVPLRIGGGTRLKIYESMAMGRAVVSTTIGAEGLPLTPSVHIALADEPAALASEILRLLGDGTARRAMEESGLALVRQRYDWAAVAGVLEDSVHSAAAARARAARRAPAPAAVPVAVPGISPLSTNDRPATERVAGRRVAS